MSFLFTFVALIIIVAIVGTVLDWWDGFYVSSRGGISRRTRDLLKPDDE